MQSADISTTGHVTLVLGGARSGKSAYAEGLAAGRANSLIYIATAEFFDDEMRDCVAHHRARRGADWSTLEAPVDLVRVLIEQDQPGRFVLIDCITIWIGNLMHHGRDVDAHVKDLCAALSSRRSDIAVVSNEVGLGIVPDNALARRFRDEAGRANQAIAAVADEVVFLAAGLPMILKAARPAPA